MVASLRVLHVAGSPVSQYYSMISVHYARQMLAGSSDEATKAITDFVESRPDLFPPLCETTEESLETEAA